MASYNPQFNSTLREIHAQVKSGFRPTSDMEQFGREEDWRLPENVDAVKDDCDGFAIACRVLLRDYGIKNRLIVCATPWGEHHLVCSAGRMILDNLQEQPMRKRALEQQGYKWICASGYEPGEMWRKIIE